MQGVVLVVPKQLVFTSLGVVEKLVIENPNSLKLAIKIKTNNKTAVQINPSHDFIEGKSKKQFMVRLVELHQGVKLEVNYTIADEEMLAKNDSKMSNVDKSLIKKEITLVNANAVKSGVAAKVQSQEANSIFKSIMVPSKPEPKIQKKQSEPQSAVKLQPQNLIVIEQKLQEDEQQFEEKMVTLKKDLQALENKVKEKYQAIGEKKKKITVDNSNNSVIPFAFLLPLSILVFLLGSGLRLLIF